MKALVAVEHPIITAIWHMLTDQRPYHDLGGTYFAQRDPNASLAERSRSSTNSVTK